MGSGRCIGDSLEAEPDTDDSGGVEADDDALVGALLDQAVEPAVPDEAECRRYYDAQPGRSRTPHPAEASHISLSYPRPTPPPNSVCRYHSTLPA